MRHFFLLAVLFLFGAARPATAQGLPPYQAVNPILTSRSGLLFQPYVDGGRRWQTRLQLDYGNAIEFSEQPTAGFILDAELLRLDATVIRNIGRGFVGGTVALQGDRKSVV